MSENVRHFYPIILKNKKLIPFQISSEIELRQLSKDEREQFFGLEKIDFIFEHSPLGYIGINKFFPSNQQKGRYPYGELFKRGLFDGSSDILASNFVLGIDCSEMQDYLIEKINLSFKLFKPTSTAGYIGFREGETDVHFHRDMPIHGPFDYLDLGENDLNAIKELFSIIWKNKDDEKFSLYSKLYERALQGGAADYDLRFLLLTTCLESLYLRENNTELKFRLAVITASLLSKNGYGQAKIIYNKVREIYDIRSIIVHQGKSDKLTWSIFSELALIVRNSLNLYLKKKTLFSGNNLPDIIF